MREYRPPEGLELGVTGWQPQPPRPPEEERPTFEERIEPWVSAIEPHLPTRTEMLLGVPGTGMWLTREAGKGLGWLAKTPPGRWIHKGVITPVLQGAQQPSYWAERGIGEATLRAKMAEPERLAALAYPGEEDIRARIGRWAERVLRIPEEQRYRPPRPGEITQYTLPRELSRLPESERERATHHLSRIAYSGTVDPEAQIAAHQEIQELGGWGQVTSEQITEVLKRHELWGAELMGQIGLDPLDWIGVGWLTGRLKRTAAAAAIKPVGELNWWERVLTHAPNLDEADDVADAIELGLRKPGKWERFIPWGKTPQAKAHELVANTVDNVMGVAVQADPEDIPRILRMWADEPGRLVTEAGEQVLSKRGQRVHYVLEDFATVASDYAETWAATADERRALRRLAMERGLTTGELFEAVGAGRITDPDIVELVNEAGPTAIEAGWKAHLLDDLAEHANVYARETFGVEAPGAIRRWVRKLKQFESFIFLDLNPGYVMRNFLNGEGTLAWDGIHDLYKGLKSGYMEEMWGKMGYHPDIGLVPQRFRAGLGMAGVEGSARFMGQLARNTERWQSARAYTQGALQGRMMLADDALGDLPPAALAELEPFDPDMPAAIRAIVLDSWDENEALERITQLPGFNSEAVNALKPTTYYMDVVADQNGIPRQVVRPVVGDVAADLDDALRTAQTPEDVADAFEGVYRVLDEGALRRAELNAEAAEAVERLRARGMGPVGLMDSMDELDDLFYKRWVSHSEELEDHWRAIREMEPKARGSAHQRFRDRADTLWSAAQREAQTKRAAILEAAQEEFGWDVPQEEILGLYDELTQAEQYVRRVERGLIDRFFARVDMGANPDWTTEVFEQRQKVRAQANRVKAALRRRIDRTLLEGAGADAAAIEQYLGAREFLLQQDANDVQEAIRRIYESDNPAEAWQHFWALRIDQIDQNQEYLRGLRRAIVQGAPIKGIAPEMEALELAAERAGLEEAIEEAERIPRQVAPPSRRTETGRPVAGVVPGELPGMPPLEAGVGRRLTSMEMPEAGRISPLFAGEEEMRAAQQAEAARRGQMVLPEGRPPFIKDPQQRRHWFGWLSDQGITHEEAKAGLGVESMGQYPGTIGEAKATLTGAEVTGVQAPPEVRRAETRLWTLNQHLDDLLEDQAKYAPGEANWEALQGKIEDTQNEIAELQARLAPELPEPIEEAPKLAGPTPEELERAIWQIDTEIQNLEETKREFPFDHSYVFGKFDYRKGEVSRNIRVNGRLQPWEYALDGQATELGYSSAEELKGAIEDFARIETRIRDLKKQSGATARLLDRADPEDAARVTRAVLDDLFQSARPIHWGEVSVDVSREVKGWLRQMQRMVADDVTQTPPGMLPPSARRRVVEYARGLGGDYTDLRVGATAIGEWARDFALLNYQQRRNYNTWLSLAFPYHFWFFTSLKNWAVRAVDAPGRLAAYAKARRTLEEKVYGEGFPARLRGSVGVPVPFMPGWMGDKLFIDPISSILPIETFRYPEETMRWKFKGGQVTGPEGQERPLNVLDVGRVIASPHLPLSLGLSAATGTLRETGYVLPMTRVMQGLSAMAAPALEARGVDVPPGGWVLEGPVREALGLPHNELWDTYRQERMLPNLAAEGKIDPETAIEAMLTHQGKAWEMAVQRAGEERAVSSVISGIGGMRAAVYPAGEQLQRQWSRDLRAVVESEVERLGQDPRQLTYMEMWDMLRFHDAVGDESTVGRFFDTHPAYEVRQKLFDTPEEREIARQTELYYEEIKQLSAEYLERKKQAPIGAPGGEGLGEWYQDQKQAIEEKYPEARVGLQPGKVYPPEKVKSSVLQSRMEKLLSGYPYPEADTDYEAWQQEVEDFERAAAAKARETWPDDFYQDNAWWVTPEGIEAWQAKRHNEYGAAAYEYRKLYQEPFWAQWRKVEAQALPGEADWENVNPTIANFASIISRYAQQYEVDPRLIAAIIRVESDGNPQAYNWGSGATGLMQVLHGGQIEGRPTARELQDPTTNIAWGTKILHNFLVAEDWDWTEALYRYSGGEEWGTRERFRETYLRDFNQAFKALWGVRLGDLQDQAREQVGAEAPTLLDLIDAILADPIYEDKDWTRESLRRALTGTEIVAALEGWQMRHPEKAEVQDFRERLNELLYENAPPGDYRKALRNLPEVQAARDEQTKQAMSNALGAVRDYMKESPPFGSPEEWAEAERLNDQVLRREVDRLFGPDIYDEQRAYFDAKDQGYRPKPSDGLKAYWDFLHDFEDNNPVWAKYYRRDGARGRARGARGRYGGGGGWGGGGWQPRKPGWDRIAQAIGPEAAQDLARYFRTNRTPSTTTIRALRLLMQQYGFTDWAEWLEYLRYLFAQAFGQPLAEFEGRPAPVVRRYLGR